MKYLSFDSAGRFLLIILIFTFFGCENLAYLFKSDLIEISEVSLSPKELTLIEGDEVQLSLLITPGDATDRSVYWSSSDSTVASVDGDGIVTAAAKGTAVITVKTAEARKQDTAGIRVSPPSPSGTFRITFVTFGGSAVDVQDVVEHGYAVEPDSPLRDGFSFDGWFIEADCLTEWEFGNDSVDSNITLYAKWKEIFHIVDKPSVRLLNFHNDESKTYKLLDPWNYDKAFNSDRDYPIVIGLHGWTELTDYYFTPVIINNEEEMQNYPCFFLAPNNSSIGWGLGAEWIRDLVAELIKTYRIDRTRIYIVGFSMGGSGSYEFTEALYNEKDLTVAGIVRIAGASNTALPDPIAKRISIWIHCGEPDDDPFNTYVYTIAEQSYEFMKSHVYYEGAEELVNYDAGFFGGFQTNNFFLSQNGLEFMRFTTYEGMGHEYAPVFENPAVLSWLFAQTVGNR